MTQQRTLDKHENNNFPFYSLTDSEFELVSSVNKLSQSDSMDRLSQLEFNPFQPNQNIALSRYNTELDTFCNTSEINCDYFLPNDFKMQIQNLNMQEKFSVLHLGIRSMSNKFDSFKNLIDTLGIHFQIIGLTETWINSSNMNCFALNEYECLGSNRTTKRGGGVGLYVSKYLQIKHRKDLGKNIEGIIETKFVEIINNNGKNLIIGIIYRPPSSNFDTFENTMNEILGKIGRENKHCYLMGDFNIDLFTSESCDYANQFVEQLFTSSFFPLINKATRITHHTATLIDNIFTNNLENLSDSMNDIIFSDISDHLPIVHLFNTSIFAKKTKNVTDVIYQRLINKANTDAFKEEIKNISWNNILNETNNPEKAYQEFFKTFSKCLRSKFPCYKKKKQCEN